MPWFWTTATVMLLLSMGSPSASPGTVAMLPEMPSVTVDVKSAVPGTAGASQLKSTRMRVWSTVTRSPSRIVTTPPASVPQNWPAPGAGQLATRLVPPTVTAVIARFV